MLKKTAKIQKHLGGKKTEKTATIQLYSRGKIMEKQ